jgi:hypothetical protein
VSFDRLRAGVGGAYLSLSQELGSGREAREGPALDVVLIVADAGDHRPDYIIYRHPQTEDLCESSQRAAGDEEAGPEKRKTYQADDDQPVVDEDLVALEPPGAETRDNGADGQEGQHGADGDDGLRLGGHNLASGRHSGGAGGSRVATAGCGRQLKLGNWAMAAMMESWDATTAAMQRKAHRTAARLPFNPCSKASACAVAPSP